MSDRVVRVDRLDFWKLAEDEGEKDAPFHVGMNLVETWCGKSTVGGMLIVATVGMVKVCGRCLRERFPDG